MIGQVLGNRYELLEKIGEGGMSVVYKARCNKLNRLVAVKVLKSEFCDNEEIVKKFKIEATAIATLSDTNIVNVLDVGTQDNVNYIVMEYVRGKTLKEIITEEGPLGYEDAINKALQIAKALKCAHDNGIIHRDVKPQNILVSENGLVKVTDFGIAKSATSSTMTSTTTVMGSAHYFSPEQAKGEVVDIRTDLYSLGVVMYEMVTGKVPFDADSPVAIALKHIQEQPSAPKAVNSKVPTSLNDLILKLMSKEPKDRYQTADDVLVDLQKIKNDPNVVLGDNKELNDLESTKTIVMDAATVANIKKGIQESNYDEYDDDEYYDDEYDDDEYYDDEEYNEVKKKKKRNLIIGISCGVVVLILAFIGAFIAFGGSNSSDSTKVKVPELKGLTIEQAKVALERKGLELVEAGTEKSSEEEGTVIDVDPKEGTEVKKGSKVRVIVSSGSEDLEMPNFVDSELDTVKTFFSKNNIDNVSYVEVYSDSIVSGKVVSTDPKAKTKIDKDTSVTVYVSMGPETPAVEYVTVSDVRGLTSSAAQAKLSAQGLYVSIQTTIVTDQSLDGIVTSVTNVGKKVEVGSTVSITVGKYNRPTETTKPVESTTPTETPTTPTETPTTPTETSDPTETIVPTEDPTNN